MIAPGVPVNTYGPLPALLPVPAVDLAEFEGARLDVYELFGFLKGDLSLLRDLDLESFLRRRSERSESRELLFDDE